MYEYSDSGVSLVEEVEFPVAPSIADQLSAFYSQAPYSHYRQSVQWLAIVGNQSSRLFISRNQQGDICAASILSLPGGLSRLIGAATVKRGPIADSATSFESHVAQIRASLRGQFSSIRINPYVLGSESELFERVMVRKGFRAVSAPTSYETTLVVPVQASPEAQWQQLRSSTRTAINKSRRLGTSIVKETTEGSYAVFAGAYSDFAEKRQLAPLSSDLLRRICSNYSDEPTPGSLLLSTRLKNRTIGQALFMRNNDSLIFEWGWTDTQARREKIPIMHPIFWEALRWCRSQCIQRLDLGGYWAAQGSKDPINQFKLGFSKEQVSACREHEATLSLHLHWASKLQEWVRCSVRT